MNSFIFGIIEIEYFTFKYRKKLKFYLIIFPAISQFLYSLVRKKPIIMKPAQVAKLYSTLDPHTRRTSLGLVCTPNGEYLSSLCGTRSPVQGGNVTVPAANRWQRSFVPPVFVPLVTHGEKFWRETSNGRNVFGRLTYCLTGLFIYAA